MYNILGSNPPTAFYWQIIVVRKKRVKRVENKKKIGTITCGRKVWKKSKWFESQDKVECVSGHEWKGKESERKDAKNRRESWSRRLKIESVIWHTLKLVALLSRRLEFISWRKWSKTGESRVRHFYPSNSTTFYLRTRTTLNCKTGRRASRRSYLAVSIQTAAAHRCLIDCNPAFTNRLFFFSVCSNIFPLRNPLPLVSSEYQVRKYRFRALATRNTKYNPSPPILLFVSPEMNFFSTLYLSTTLNYSYLKVVI